MESRTQNWPQAAVVAAGGALLCLLVLMGFHAELSRLYGFDLTVQTWVHARTSGALRPFMLALTGIGAISVFASALGCVLVWLLWRGEREQPAVLGVALGGAMLLNETLKLHFHRARPAVLWALGDEHTYSFPSGHALFSVVLYGTLCRLAMRRGVSWWRVVPPAVLLPLAIGGSRVALGEHWPTDVLAGWLCGAVWMLTIFLAERFFWQDAGCAR